jgi:hypothetical protein
MDFKDRMMMEADAMKFAPLNQRHEWMMGRYTPVIDFGYKPPTVFLDSHNVAVMNSNGDWEQRDPAGKRTGTMFTSRAPNQLMSRVEDLEPLPMFCRHGMRSCCSSC